MFTRFNQDYFRDSLTFPRTAFEPFEMNVETLRNSIIEDFLNDNRIGQVRRFVTFLIHDDWTIFVKLKDRTGFDTGEEKFFTNISIQGKDIEYFKADDRTVKIKTRYNTYVFDICNIVNMNAVLTRQDRSGPNRIRIPDLASIDIEFSEKDISIMVTSRKYAYLENIFGPFEHTETADLEDFFSPEPERMVFKDHYVVNTPLELNDLMYKKLRKSRFDISHGRGAKPVEYPAVVSLPEVKAGRTFDLQHTTVQELKTILSDLNKKYS